MTQLSAALFLDHKLIQLSCATTSKFDYALANLAVHGRLHNKAFNDSTQLKSTVCNIWALSVLVK